MWKDCQTMFQVKIISLKANYQIKTWILFRVSLSASRLILTYSPWSWTKPRHNAYEQQPDHPCTNNLIQWQCHSPGEQHPSQHWVDKFYNPSPTAHSPEQPLVINPTVVCFNYRTGNSPRIQNLTDFMIRSRVIIWAISRIKLRVTRSLHYNYIKQ